MTIPILHNEYQPYPELSLERWKNGDYSILTTSQASEYIKKVLVKKAKERPGRRFFGEAFIASQITMREGWYNSFKWLTTPKWISGYRLEPEFERSFCNALIKHFGVEMLTNLQNHANTFFENHKSELLDEGKAKKPVAPDLLIINKNDEFKFIESKLPGDTIKPHQIAGLALIRKYLNSSRSIDVSVVNLYPQGSNPFKDNEISKEYLRLYQMV